MPNYLGPADHLVYEGRIIQRGEMVAASGKDLQRLKDLGHNFEGHEQATGPIFVDQPVSPLPAMGANGGPITTGEVLASSSEHQAAVHEAAVQAEEKPARVSREESAKH